MRKLDTVNVFVTVKGLPTYTFVSYPNTREGNGAAEKLFVKLIKEHTENASRQRKERLLRNGKEKSGYQLAIVRGFYTIEHWKVLLVHSN